MALPQDDTQLPADLRMVLGRLVKKLRSKSPTHAKLSLTERAVIKQLNEHQPMLPSELARREKVTTQSMSQILNHLLELDYIIRTPSETDKRKVMISLSDTGQALLANVRHEGDEWLAKAIEHTCSPDEQTILRQALGPLSKLVDFD